MELHLSGGELTEDILLSSDPGSFCRQKTVVETLRFFGKPIDEWAALSALRGAADTARYLRHSQLNVKVYVPVVFFLSFRMWIVWAQSPMARTFRSRVFEQWVASATKSATIYHASALDLYGIPEVWSHCVGQFQNMRELSTFDPYAGGLTRDYPDGRYRLINSDSLKKLKTVKIMVSEST